ncbi:hypothetical protein HGRIS_006928 [Hohenbuehelia grisea]|uniref:Cytochrome P450 n=1 Tax=Hohenbuehelia grisea TaxID=104357 RepID=A0ABR3JAM3_9AGAR
MPLATYIFLSFLPVFIFVIRWAWTGLHNSWRLPPGPKGWPILGNVFDMPTEKEWLHWRRYKELYGPVSSLAVLGQHIIVLNSWDACHELLERRSAHYSGRPEFPFAGRLIGWDQQLILAAYGDRFRAMRRLLHAYIGTRASVSTLTPIMERKVQFHLRRMLERPEALSNYIWQLTGSILLEISHGYETQVDSPDPIVSAIEAAAKEFYIATKPGSWIIDILPSYIRIPEWLPGLQFPIYAKKFRQTLQDATNLPHDYVELEMALQKARPSFTKSFLDANSDPDIGKYTAEAIYAGGADTIAAQIDVFFLAMTLFPDVQQRVQSEIDQVVGNGRLPTYKDKDSLPFFAAVYKEVLRWHPIGPMGIPHSCDEDDEYNGLFIPKGSLILTNIWGLAHDAENYKDPADFNPSRFLPAAGTEPEPDPRTYAFGFGRRRCPGLELAEAIIFHVMTTTLAIFDVEKPTSPSGDTITPTPEFLSGTISRPKSFSCRLVPRTSEALSLIQ